MTRMNTEIPDPALVVLIGQSGSGKSTLAGTWPASQVLELDHYRALVADDPGDQDATSDAAFVLESVLDARLERGLNCVVDATNTDRTVRSGLLKIAARHGMPTVALLMSTTLPAALERNSGRPANRRVPDNVVRAQYAAMIAAHPGLHAEGFDHVVFSDAIGRLQPLLHRVSEQQIRELGWDDSVPGRGRELLVRRCFGPEVARLATWQDGSTRAGGAPVVVIQAGEEYLTLALRYTADGPVFEVQLPCPTYESCPGPAWLPVHSADDLLQAHRGDLDSERELTCAHDPAHTPASDDTER